MRKERGITLLELLFVIGITALIAIPAWKIFHHGTQASLRGVIQNDTFLEGRMIIQYLRLDLARAAPRVKISANDPTKAFPGFDVELVAPENSLNPAYSFIAFPNTADNGAELVRITYKTESGPNNYQKKLTRIVEQLAPGPEKRLSSKTWERVNHFSIEKVDLTQVSSDSKRILFWVNLSLCDVYQPKSIIPDKPNKANNTAGVIIGEWFDVVQPEALNSIYSHPGYLSNWYSFKKMVTDK